MDVYRLLSLILLSYNHEQYILQMLESIFHQHKQYGRGKNIQLIIADDASCDHTFQIEHEWVYTHRYFFKEVLLLPSDVHRGINRNYIRALSHVSEEYFKVLSGDDLLADIDILSELSEADMHLFAYFSFNNCKLNSKSNDYMSLHSQYLFWGEDFVNIKKYSQVIFPLSLIGAVFKKTLINQELFYCLSQYEYLEDRPFWDFFIRKNNAEIKYINSPIALYRHSSTSISNDATSNAFHDAFLSDRILYWKRKRRNIKNYLDKVSVSIYILRLYFPRLRLISFFFPYNYLKLFKMFSKATFIKNLSNELDKKYFEKNQSFLLEMEELSKTVAYL